jgi:hypothetical protein
MSQELKTELLKNEWKEVTVPGESVREFRMVLPVESLEISLVEQLRKALPGIAWPELTGNEQDICLGARGGTAGKNECEVIVSFSDRHITSSATSANI